MMLQKSKGQYAFLPDIDEDKISTQSHDQDLRLTGDNEIGTWSWIRTFALKYATTLNIMFFCVSFMMCVWSAIGVRKTMCDDKTAWRILNAYSPITEDIDLKLHLQRMSGDVLDTDGDMLRQKPSPEVDLAWNNLTLGSFGGAFAWVSSQDLVQIGKNPNVTVKLPQALRFGDDAYVVTLDVFHKLHCLNRLRKAIHPDYYYGETFPDRNYSELVEWHVNHCLHILVQSFLCEANTDLIPMVWYDRDYPLPFSDFNINRKCGDINSIRRWQEQHDVSPASLYSVVRPEAQETLPMSQELRRILSQIDSDGDR